LLNLGEHGFDAVQRRDRQIGQEHLDFRPAHVARMTQAMKANEALGPIHVAGFRARRIMPQPDRAPQAVQVHVVKPPSISRESAYRVCLLPIYALFSISIAMAAVIVGLIGRDRFAKVKRRRRSRTAGVFPLGFGWETVRLIVLFLQPFAKLLAILPRNLFHW
jgi:hypothetical protein